MVFFGELGHESNMLVKYFEDRGAKPIDKQENPAAWVLRAYAGEEMINNADWAELYKTSDQFSYIQNQIASIRETSTEKNKVTLCSTFSTPMAGKTDVTSVT